jgi:hypothetical protein
MIVPRYVQSELGHFQNQLRTLGVNYVQYRLTGYLNAINAAGEAAYGAEWSKALDQVETFPDGKLDPADAAAILSTDNPERAFFELGNGDEYHRIMDLPPARRPQRACEAFLEGGTEGGTKARRGEEGGGGYG